MLVAGGGFGRCCNAAAVAAGSLLVVAVDVVQAPNDKRQVEPMLEKVADVPDALGTAAILLADTGYFSAANVEAAPSPGLNRSSPWAASGIIRPGPPAASSALGRAVRAGAVSAR